MICYNNFMEVFTIRFCKLLEQSARTQIQLADYIGVSRQCINDYKNGKAFPSLIIFKRMCEYFNVSADYLLGISDRWYLFAIRIDSVISESGCRLLSYTLTYLCCRNSLVKYYLTCLFFVKSFNGLVGYYRTRLFISATEPILSSNTWHAYFLLRSYNRLVSGTAWQDYFW